jgi:hypothetical protein
LHSYAPFFGLDLPTRDWSKSRKSIAVFAEA